MQRLELPNLETPQRSHQLVPAAHQSDSSKAPLTPDPSSRFGIFFWTGIVTLLWLGGTAGFFLSFYRPDSEQSLPASEIVGLVFLLLLPVFLIWFLAIVLHYAIGLRQSSRHLGEIASQFTEPEESAAEDVVQLGKVVRTQLDFLNTEIENALSKVGKLEEDIYQYSDNLSQTAQNAERRIDEVRTKLEAERNALEALTQSLEKKGIDVSESLKNQTDSLKEASEKTFKQIEAADNQLQNRIEMLSDAANAALKTSTESEKQLEEQYAKLNDLSNSAFTRASDIASRYDHQHEAINETTDRLAQENAKLESLLETQRLALGQIGELVSSQAQQIEYSVSESAKELESTVASAADRAARMGEDFTQQAESVKASGEQVAATMNSAAQAAHAAAQNAQDAIDGRIESITTAIKLAFATADEVAQRSQEALATRVTTIADDIEAAGGAMEGVVQRTEQSLAQQINSIAKHIETASATAAGVAQQSRQAFVEHAKTITEDIESASTKAVDIAQDSQQAFTEQVKGITQDIQTASTQAEEVLQKSQVHLSERLDESAQKIRLAGSSAKELVEQSQHGFSEQTKELTQELEESGARIDALTSKAQQSFAQRNSLLKIGIKESVTLDTALQAKLKFNREALRGLLSYLDLDNIEAIPILAGEPSRIEAKAKEPEGETWRQRPDLQPFAEADSETANAGNADEQAAPTPSNWIQVPGATKPRVNFRPPKASAPSQILSNNSETTGPTQPEQPQGKIDDLAERLTARLQKARGIVPNDEAPNGPSADAASTGNYVQDGPSLKTKATMPHFEQTIANQLKDAQNAEQGGLNADKADPSQEIQDGTRDGGQPMSPGTGQLTMASKQGWKWRDILAAADSQAAQSNETILLNDLKSNNIPRTSLHIIETLQAMTVDLDRALEEDPPVELVYRYLNGERNLFARRIIHQKQDDILEHIQSKYNGDREFKHNVDRYLSQFETLLNNTREKDRENILAETYLSSDTGKVYLLITKALDRIEH